MGVFEEGSRKFDERGLKLVRRVGSVGGFFCVFVSMVGVVGVGCEFSVVVFLCVFV